MLYSNTLEIWFLTYCSNSKFNEQNKFIRSYISFKLTAIKMMITLISQFIHNIFFSQFPTKIGIISSILQLSISHTQMKAKNSELLHQTAIMSLFVSLFILIRQVQFVSQTQRAAILNSSSIQVPLTNANIRAPTAALYT